LTFQWKQAPALVTQFLWSVLPDSQRLCGGVQFYYSQITNLLVIANSSVNFVIYLTFNTRFRQVGISKSVFPINFRVFQSSHHFST
jgi:hypothetical protein